MKPWHIVASLAALAAVLASRRAANEPADSSSADDWRVDPWAVPVWPDAAQDQQPAQEPEADSGSSWLDGLETSDLTASIMGTINRVRGTAASGMAPSSRVLDKLRKRERLMTTRYELGDGGWTIGYGHFTPYGQTPPPATITPAEAEAILLDDVEQRAAKWVRAYVTAPLTQAQFDALVHFAFNVSPKATKAVADEVNAGRDPEPVMLRYVLPGSKFERGLRNRRAEEIALYRSEGIATA